MEDGLFHMREDLLVLLVILDGCEELAMVIHRGVHQGYLGVFPSLQPVEMEPGQRDGCPLLQLHRQNIQAWH